MENENNSLDDRDESYFVDDDLEDILIEPTLDSGIRALDMSYLWDKRMEKLVEPFKRAIYFMKAHTTLTEEEIIDRINRNILDIEVKDEYKENPIGIGYVDGMLNILSVNAKMLESEPEEVYTFIRHEMTHMLGNSVKRRFWGKEWVLISGYSRESIVAKDINKGQKKNESFNEAAVEMFVYQDDEYKTYKIFDEIPINTNQDFNGGYYCVNSNLIHQLIIARGMEEQDFFEGLYNTKTAQKNIRKFPQVLFRKISENMDRITDDINLYFDADDVIYDMQQKGENGPFDQEESKKSSAKEDLKKRISESERMIIDRLLVPRLMRVSLNERQTLLDQYFQFIICEKEYFKERTGYQIMEKADKSWLKQYAGGAFTNRKQKEKSRKKNMDKDFDEL